ncbi:MAG: serine/threonine-protein kinase [Candidatus Micrarchaeia archaeon]
MKWPRWGSRTADRASDAQATGGRREISGFKIDYSDPLVGEIIHENKYEILGKIGGGGMGNVYIALDRRTNEHVAVKVLSENSDSRYKMTDRFFKEAKASVLVDHENVIKVFDVGAFGNKVFLVLELLEGDDLFKTLEREKTIGAERTARIMIQISDALGAAHAIGIIHRDMKPANIVLIKNERTDDFVKVIDFGLTKFTHEDEGITRDGLVMGTVTYMAPEQVWGGSKYDHRVDIYAMGVIMYEMLTGAPPFRSTAENERDRIFQVLMMHRETPPVRPREIDPSIPQGLEDVVMRALEKDPQRRYGTTKEMKDALTALGYKTEEIEELEAEPDEEPTELAGNLQKEPAGKPEAEHESSGEEGRTEEVAPLSNKEINKVLSDRLKRAIDDAHEAIPAKGSGHGRSGAWARRLLIGTIIAGAAGAGYHYRDRIRAIYEDLRHGRESHDRADPAPQNAAPPASVQRITFEARIETNPPGASVYDVSAGGEVFLGGSPLRVALSPADHTLSIRKRGYRRESVRVGPGSPTATVNLVRSYHPRPADSAQPEPGGGGAEEIQPVENQQKPADDKGQE